MARKDVLKGLMGLPEAPARLSPEPDTPRATRGAIGAISSSIAALKASAVVELDPFAIEPGGLADRLETDDAADGALRASIAEHGQQVPVLVRPHPERDGRYQIVYGRRRVLAMRDLGRPVKALVRDLDDRELVLAQGQENTARRDLSFIEKVNFARQLEENGYDRKVICDALSVDKTLASRMLSVAERVPAPVIAMIGAAHAVGRDRWLRLAEMLEETGTEADELLAMIELTKASDRSDDRFRAAWTYLSGLVKRRRRADNPRPEATRVYAPDGLPLGQVKYDRNFCTLKLRLANTDGFEDWLLQALPSLYADWQQTQPAAADSPPETGDT